MLILISYLTYSIIADDDKSLFMPGDLTSGHHQIGVACTACHGEAFSDKDAIQQKCESCHGDQRKKPFDTHPRTKFTDPRNADRLENIDARYCITCHTEHQPNRTDHMGVSQPMDFCIHCHKDIAKDRPSHEGIKFDSCANAGCHNYHNNRSLYTDFLIKHKNDADIVPDALLPMKEFSSLLEEITTYPHDRYPQVKLQLQDMDAPSSIIIKADQKIKHSWANTAHAKSGVNCTACHMQKNVDNSQPEWINKPDQSSCSSCHDIEIKTFQQGKHGMRLAQQLPPMQPELARLEMTKKSSHLELNCNSCHIAHDYNMQKASVESCLDCHNDQHSLAYKGSKHFNLWQEEQSGEAPAGSGVSCASCHMPRVSMDVSEWLSRTVVQHNQNATLTPNEKMIRPVCLNCHGLGFSMNAMADKALINRNFKGSAAIHIESIDMAVKDSERANQERQE